MPIYHYHLVLKQFEFHYSNIEFSKNASKLIVYPTIDTSCITDFDLDNVDDIWDSCRNDPTISELTMLPYTSVKLSTGTPEPIWKISDMVCFLFSI